MFDKLGDLLSDALEKGEIPKYNSESGNDSQSESIEGTFSDFDFITRHKKHEDSHSEKKAAPEKPVTPRIIKIPAEVKEAMTFIGIPEDASFETAKKIYREKLMYYHPDRRNDNPVLQKVAKEKTARLLKEWEIIEKWYSGQ